MAPDRKRNEYLKRAESGGITVNEANKLRAQGASILFEDVTTTCVKVVVESGLIKIFKKIDFLNNFFGNNLSCYTFLIYFIYIVVLTL